MDAAPFAPGQAQPVFFAMCGDDCELFFERDELNEKQQAEDRENRDLTSLLQVALMYMGKPADHVALFDTFLKPPWADLLKTFNGLHRAICGPVVPLEHCHFYPHEMFYARAAAGREPGALGGLYMISGSNQAVHQSRRWWSISQAVNSKMRLAADAPAHGIPVPETLVTTKDALSGEQATAFFVRHQPQLMLKIKGLAGARNVTPVYGLADCEDYLRLFGADTEVVLQERLDADEWTELLMDTWLMSSKFRTVDQDTLHLLRPSVQGWLPDDHLALFVVDVVERLDLSALERQYSGGGKRRSAQINHPAGKALVASVVGKATAGFSARTARADSLGSLRKGQRCGSRRRLELA